MEEIETTDAGTTENVTDSVPEAVTEKLNEVFGDDTGFNQTAARQREQEEAEELVEEGVVTPDGNTPAEEKTIQGESSETPDTTEAVENDATADESAEKPGENKPALDPFLRFVGMNSGLTAEQIDKMHAADPETATATLGIMANQFNNLSRQLLEPQGPPVAPAAPAEQQAAQTPTPGLDKFMSDLAGFTEANGEDIGKFAKLVNDELVTPLKSLMAANAVRESELVKAEALSGFEEVRKNFEDFYGKADGQLTPGQQQARATVANIADQVRAGAKAQGKTVSIKEAISRAHAIVTHDMQQSAARKQVAAQVQKRAASATSKPTQRNAKPKGEKSDKAAEDAYRQKAMEMGLDQF